MVDYIYPAARADEEESGVRIIIIMSIRRCPKNAKRVHEVRDPHNNIRLPHEELHAALSRAEQSSLPVLDSLQETGLCVYMHPPSQQWAGVSRTRACRRLMAASRRGRCWLG